MTIERKDFLEKINRSIENNPVTALVGSRQSGKTTLAKEIAQNFAKNQPMHYFDLENPEHLFNLENAFRALENLEGLIVIDEIQHKPDLFPMLRVFSDRNPLPAKFLVLGSASGDLLRQTSESLAGRIEYIELPGFGIEEIDPSLYDQLWLLGGYPKSFLAKTPEDSYRWRQQFMQTFLEKDIGVWGLKFSPIEMFRFWQMIAHYHGQTCNYSEIGKSLSISHNTVKNYLNLLTDTFMIRQLSPWFQNIGKSMVKSPKIYIRDSGLLHSLFGIQSIDNLRRHPKLGFSWEGFALEQIIRKLEDNRNIFFWSTHGNAEIDLITNIRGERWGFEIKYTDAPKSTKSMSIALESLELNRIYVIYPGTRAYFIKDNVEAIPLTQIHNLNFKHH